MEDGLDRKGGGVDGIGLRGEGGRGMRGWG